MATMLVLPHHIIPISTEAFTSTGGIVVSSHSGAPVGRRVQTFTAIMQTTTKDTAIMATPMMAIMVTIIGHRPATGIISRSTRID